MGLPDRIASAVLMFEPPPRVIGRMIALDKAIIAASACSVWNPAGTRRLALMPSHRLYSIDDVSRPATPPTARIRWSGGRKASDTPIMSQKPAPLGGYALPTKSA